MMIAFSKASQCEDWVILQNRATLCPGREINVMLSVEFKN